ncbi:MAG: hypothetical protein R6U37_09605 [Dehalococcoidia bacterium]
MNHKRLLLPLAGLALGLLLLVACGTSQTAITPMPGWEKFEGEGAQLWLPQSYEGGDPGKDAAAIAESLRGLSPDFEQMAQVIEQNPSMYVIWAFDSEAGGTGFLTNAAVTQETVSASTIDAYLDDVLNHLPLHLYFKVLERDMVTLGGSKAGRLVLEFANYGVAGKEVVYALKDGSTMWVLTFATGAAEFEERLPVFEQSALTFTTQP